MGKKHHILVADDEPSIREVLRDLILALGDEYIVYTAANSFEALHLLHSVPLELALIDICMPGLNGLELLKKAREKFPQVMIVIVTGQPSYQMVLEALRLGATDFLSKPISLAELRGILKKLKERETKPGPKPTQEITSDFSNSGNKQENPAGQHFLYSLGEKLAAIKNAGELYSFLTEMALILIDGTHSALFLYDQELGRLQLVSRSGENDNHPLESIEFKVKTKENSLDLPLKLRDELIGVLHVYGRRGGHFKPEAISRLKLLADRVLLTLENLILHESIFSNLYDSLKALINSLEARDAYSRHHSIRVTYVAALFAEKLQLPTELVDSLRLAGPLHDIGKIGIPDSILLKPDKLDPEELEVIRQHPVIGENIVAPLNLLPRERAIILHHHERWDGKGYSKGLAGEEIPFLSRIIALADSYDAITSDRPYRKSRTHEEALAEIALHAGSQFDPELAGQFVNIMSQPQEAEEICSITAKIEDSQSLSSNHQLLQLKKSLSPKIVPFNGYNKKTRRLFPPVEVQIDL